MFNRDVSPLNTPFFAIAKALITIFLFLFSFLPAFCQTEINVKVRADQPDVSIFLRSHQGEVKTEETATWRSALPWTQNLRRIEPLWNPEMAKVRTEGIIRIFTLRFDEYSASTAMLKLKESGAFEFVEENHKTQLEVADEPVDTATDPRAFEQWYHRFIKTYEAWQVTRGDASVVVGVLDTGIDYTHPELVGQMAITPAEDINGNGSFEPWPDTVTVSGITGDFDNLDNDGNGYADDVIGYDFTDQPRNPVGGDYLFPDPNPRDDNAHGTLVSGIVVAKADNGLGGAGIAPGCRVRVIRVFAGDGSGDDDDIARGIVYAADNGIKILNFSFGSVYPSLMMHEAIQYAYSKGVVMIASAGNGTGDNIHYPSSFNEVISVSASSLGSDNVSEYPWLLTSFGLTVSLCAPGNGILCPTLPEDTLNTPNFDFYSGTSTSAPMVSAAVALLFSQRGAQSPQQVRNILVSSTDDISDEGWDHYTGAGRLNIEQMLKVVGGGNVQILSPENDFGGSSDTLWITGTVLDPGFSRFHVEYQPGTEGDDLWLPVATDLSEQVKDDTLAMWRLTGLPDGEYTLRIRVERTDGRTIEDRVRYQRDRTAPVFTNVRAVPAWDNHERAMLITSHSSDQGFSVLHFRKLGASTYQQYTFDRTTLSAFWLVPASALTAADYEYFVRSRNYAGLTTDSPLDTFTFAPVFLPLETYKSTGLELSMGMYMNQPYDMDGDGLKEVVLSNYEDQLSFGQMEIHEYNAGVFVKVDSFTFKPVLLPKDIADTDGDGRTELLCSVNDSAYWLEATAPGGYPSVINWANENNSLYAARFADTDGDGQEEMLLKDFKDYYVFERSGTNWSQSAALPDITPDYTGSLAPRILSGDFDGDSKPELIYGDYDGDFIVYEWNGSAYVNTYSDTTDYTRLGTYISQGDFDGDGTLEIFTAAHTSLLLNDDFEYDAPHWQLRILKATADNTYTVVWTDYLFDVDSESYNAATTANVDTDPADELIFSTFPRTYILDYNAGNYGFSWFSYGAIATHHVAGDFNSNGVNEFALGFGDYAEFFEADFTYNGPRPPASLSGLVLDSSSVRLTWPAGTNASSYLIWRGDVTGSGSVLISAIDSVATTSFVDTGLTNRADYLYVVQSKNSLLTPVYSDFSFAVILRPHPKVRIDSVTAISGNLIKVWFSEPAIDRPEDLIHFDLDGSETPTAATGGGEPQPWLQLSFPGEMSAGAHLLSVDTLWQDAFLGTVDPAFSSVAFNWLPDTNARVWLTRWEAANDKEAILHYNLPMDNSAIDVAHYALAPYGSVLEVSFEDASHTAVRVRLDEPVLGALGYPVSIIVTGVTATDGSRILVGEGNVATFSSFKEDNSLAYVYPNPVRPNQLFNGVRFANLTRYATITIYTTDGRFVNTLTESDGDGGTDWNLRDSGGKLVQPGIYLFRVEAEDVEEFLGKFSVLEY